ncbi:MAG: hypothetical protein IJM98_10810, partial [Oscillospiraceae bacterium]|nr:hypothetical protein [Oscillospiraceae bacterium]
LFSVRRTENTGRPVRFFIIQLSLLYNGKRPFAIISGKNFANCRLKFDGIGVQSLRIACYPSSTAASGGPPVLLRCPKYSAAYALNILTAAPNPARCFAHWARFAGFALWEGCPPGCLLTAGAGALHCRPKKG